MRMTSLLHSFHPTVIQNTTGNKEKKTTPGSIISTYTQQRNHNQLPNDNTTKNKNVPSPKLTQGRLARGVNSGEKNITQQRQKHANSYPCPVRPSVHTTQKQKNTQK